MALTLKNLIRHAKRYGTDGVLDTAVEYGYDVESLARLIEAMDQVEADAARARRFGTVKRHRLTPEQRAKRLLGIEETNDETEVTP